MKHFRIYCFCIALLGVVACNEPEGPTTPPTTDPATVDFLPQFDYNISEWNGETATDAIQDVAGNDAGIFHEANTFSSKVTVTYTGTDAVVESDNSDIVSHIEGAYVTIDMLSHSVNGVEIILKGETTDGGLKVYGGSKYKLTLQGVSIESQRGAAINNQCKKAVFVHLTDGTTNNLTDAQNYIDDTYYLNPSATEDCKACFFSEGDILFSGTGILKIAGKFNHALATDDFLNVRPGVTLVITEAAKNGIQVKGDAKANLGIKIAGGLIYANVTSPAGKAMKSDLGIDVMGGQLLLNVSGDGVYDTESNDTSSAACIKTDTNLSISGGKHVLKSTGLGGKGINADGGIVINGGETTVNTTGVEYVYNDTYSSSSKAVKTDSNITVNGGKFYVAAIGECDSAEGIDCAGTLTVNGGETYVNAYDDAVNISSAINITDGKIYAYSLTKDGIDTDGTLSINGGTTIGIGASNQKSGINASESSKFIINGGTVISLGGTMQCTNSSESVQVGKECKQINAESCDILSVVDNNEQVIFSLKSPRDLSNEVVFFSTPNVTAANIYSVSTQITPSTTTSWCGLYIE